jgi:two-component system response regulator
MEILLVEDNLGDIRLIQEALKDSTLQNNLRVVRDGDEALTFLRRQGTYSNAPRPNIILLDLNLPGKNGHEVLAEVKQDNSLKRIPVVILTTSTDQDDIRVSYDLHANCFITKPAELNRFVDVVRRIEHFWLEVVELPVA